VRYRGEAIGRRVLDRRIPEMDQPILPAWGEPSRPEASSEGKGKVGSSHRPLRARDARHVRRPGLDGPCVETGESTLRSEAAESCRDQIGLRETAASTPEAIINGPRLPTPMARFPEAERRRLHKMICMQC